MKDASNHLRKNRMRVLIFIILSLFSIPKSFSQTPQIAASVKPWTNNLKGSAPQHNNVIISLLYDATPSKNSYIQIYNADTQIINLNGWSLWAIADGRYIFYWLLSGDIKPGETLTVGDGKNQLFTPDFVSNQWKSKSNKWNGKNNDGARLFKSFSLIDDAYSNDDWSAGGLVRNEDEGTASTSYTSSQWTITSDYMDYSKHNCKYPIIDIGPGHWSELTKNYGRGASYNIIDNVDVDTDAPAECYSIYIQRNNQLTVNPLAALTINKNLNNFTSNEAFTVDADSTGSGSVIIHGISDNGTVKVYFKDTEAKIWNFISSPVRSAYSSIYKNDYLRYYYEPRLSYVSITSTSTKLKVGRGYVVKKTQDHIEKYEGILNGGTIQIPKLSNTLGSNYSTDGKSGWNLIGNPYPSAIDWDKVTIPHKMRGQVSVWVATKVDGVYVSDWKVWVNGFGDPDAHYIQPGESFFVFSTGEANLSFDPSIQVHHFASANTKSSQAEADKPILEIEASGNKLSSSFYLRFMEGAHFGYDPKLDAFKVLSESEEMPQIYSEVDALKIAANSIPIPAENDSLHLDFSAGLSGHYQLNFKGIENFDPEQSFYLLDKFSGQITDLRQSPQVEFDYQVNDPINRFDLLFGLINGTNNRTPDEFGSNIYEYAGNIYIRTNYPQAHNLKVEIRNILGQMVYTTNSINDFRNGKNLNLPEATYLVSIRDKDYAVTQKIRVHY